MKAIYPGTFDPITLGHVNLIERAASLFDEVIIGVAVNEKKKPLFQASERLRLVSDSLHHLSSVTVKPLDGLLVDFALKYKANVIVRGIRTTADFEYEYQLALMNRKLRCDIETLFLTPLETYSALSSSLIKEIASLGGSISAFVPDCVERALQKKFIKET